MQYVSLGLRLTVVLVLLAAAAGKVRGRRPFGEFVTAVEEMARSVPWVRAPAVFARRWAPPAVAAELVVAVLLPWPATALAGGVLAVALFAVLTAAVVIAARHGSQAPCACFGRITRTVGVAHVVRNGVLTGLAAVSLLVTLSDPAGPVSPPGAGLCLLAAAVAAALVVRWDDLADLFSAPALEVRR